MNIFSQYQKTFYKYLISLKKKKVIDFPSDVKNLTVEPPPKNQSSDMSCNIAMLLAKHNNSTPIVGLTAYSFNMAKILDKHVDFILVGDSLGMTLYGMKNTQKVTLDMMINHGKDFQKCESDSRKNYAGRFNG